MDYSPHPRLALRAIRYANVRFGILPPQSGFRRNNELIQTFPGRVLTVLGHSTIPGRCERARLVWPSRSP